MRQEKKGGGGQRPVAGGGVWTRGSKKGKVSNQHNTPDVDVRNIKGGKKKKKKKGGEGKKHIK